MANPSADYPAAVHTPTDVSAFTAQYLGSTSPTHSNLEGKQEAELVAVQTKIGTGASTPALGKVLTGTGAGTSEWANPTSVITTKGDLPAGNGSGAEARLAVGTDGQVLTADAASTLGIKWATTPTLLAAGVFNVMDYGAHGDGASDDIAHINDAIAAATAASGGIIFFPKGVYYISAPIILPSYAGGGPPVILQGAGPVATIIKPFDATFDVDPVASLLQCCRSYATIRDLMLDGRGDELALTVNLLDINGAYSVHVDNVYLTNTGGVGLYVHGASLAGLYSNISAHHCFAYGVHIDGTGATDNKFANINIGGDISQGEHCTVGLRVESSNNFFANLHVWECDTNGIEVTAPSATRISNSFLDTNEHSGIYAEATQRLMVSNTLFWKNGNNADATPSAAKHYGLYLNNGDEATITGCVFHDQYGNAAYLYGGSMDVTFSGCRFQDNDQTALAAYQSGRVNISGCQFERSGYSGISLTESDHCSITGCGFIANGSNGIIGADSRWVVVNGCQFTDPNGSPLQDRPISTTGTSTGWVIVGNVMLTADHATGSVSLAGVNTDEHNLKA